MGRRVYSREQYRPNKQLVQARIEVTYNTEAVLRELDAINKFCDESYQPELLAEARQARQGHQDYINSRRYQRYVVILRDSGRTNPKQLAVLYAAKSMYQRLACIAGPPGTGKTRSLRQLVTGLRYCGYTFLVTALSNVAIDNDATEVYHNLPDDLRDTTKVLRVEVGGAELQAVLTQVNVSEGLEHTNPAKYKELKDAADSPELTRAMQKMMVVFAEFDDEHERLRNLGKDVENVKEL